MYTDIKFKNKSFWSDAIIYRNIDNLEIVYNDYQVLISFDKQTKKGIKHMFFAIPKTELQYITKRIRDYE